MKNRKRHKNNSFFDGLALSALSVFLLFYSVYHQKNDPVHYEWSLSPYLFPTILSCVLLLLSLALFLKKKPESPDASCPASFAVPDPKKTETTAVPDSKKTETPATPGTKKSGESEETGKEPDSGKTNPETRAEDFQKTGAKTDREGRRDGTCV